MSGEDPKVSAEVSGGTAQGVIGAGEVHVERLIINNYAQPSPAADKAVRTEPLVLPENPYKGLSHFGPTDAGLFFGRQKAIDKLVRAVQTKSFNAVLGPSGCGKSSVILAGVAPALHATGQWAFTYFRVSDSLEKDPFLALAQSLLPLYLPELDETDRLVQRRKLGAALREGEIPISDVLDAIRRNHPERRVLLIADQFEELYTSNIDPGLQTRFMDLLIEAARTSTTGSPPVFSLAVTLRADFLGVASLHRPFADAIDESAHVLGPMEAEELREAIVEPAGLRDVVFEDGLVETILADVGQEPGNLPLLEFALTQMWEQQQDRRLTLAAYDSVGRVTGALTKHADRVFESLADDDKAGARRVFTQMVRLGAGTEDTRRVARRDELSDAIWPLVQRLAGPDCRLVVTNATADEGETAEVVHETLIKHWGRLRHWVTEDRVFLTWLEAFRVFLGQWAEHGQRDEDLLRGAALGQAEEWHSKRAKALNDTESAFIDASVEARDRQAREEKERQERELKTAKALARRRRTLAYGSALAATALAIMGWFLNEARIVSEQAQARAEKAQRIATAQNLAAVGELQVLTGNAEEAALGALLVIESLKRASTLQGRRAYEKVLQYYPPLILEMDYDEVGVSNSGVPLAVTPDGRLFAIGTSDGRTEVWELEARSLLFEAKGAEGAVRAVAFSPDGTQLAAAGIDGVTRIWNLRASKVAQELAHPRGAQTILYGSNETLITGGLDDTARIWDLREPDPNTTPTILEHFTGDVVALGLSQDKRWLATIGWHGSDLMEENVLKVWDTKFGARTGGYIHGDVQSTAFSPDGRFLAIGGIAGYGDDEPRIRKTQIRSVLIESSKTNEPDLVHLPVFAMTRVGSVRSLVFDSDSKWLIIAGGGYRKRESSVTVWDFAKDRVAASVDHKDPWFVALVSNGERLVTASRDKVRVWDLAHGEAVLPAGEAANAQSDVAELPGDVPSVCERIGRNLSAEEWKQYFGDQDYQETCPIR